MPEGDTLHKLARRLAPELCGAVLTRAEARASGPMPAALGCAVREVIAVGKNLVIHLEGGWSLRVHLGIRGRCHRYRVGERWRRGKSAATLVLATDEHEVVFFEAPQVQLVRSAHLRASPALRVLGVDLAVPEADLGSVVRRIRLAGQGGRSLAELLLDQRIAAGIGNVYKSEVLFVRRLSPWRSADDCDDDDLLALWGEAGRMLRANLDRRGRVTVPEDVQRRTGVSRWVYRRSGEPCLQCGGAIRGERQGDQARMTYYCAACQHVARSRGRR